MMVSPITSSTTTVVVLGDWPGLAGAGDAIDQLLANAAADLADAAGRNRDHDAAELADEVPIARVRRHLLIEEEAGEEVDRRRQRDAGGEAHCRRRHRAEPVVGRDRAEAAEGGDENAHHPRAEEAGPAMIEIVIEAGVEMLEDLAEHQRHHQEYEPEGADGQKDSERIQ